jgi:membrane protease YdiL (CAAX protease family)
MSQRTGTIRVKPRPSVGVAIFVGYVVLFTVGFLASGVDYDDVGDTTSNVLRAMVIPVWVGAAVLLGLTAFLGWWRPVFRDDERSPRWTLLIPAFMALGIVAGLATADWGGRDASFIVWLLVGTIAVGIAEETLTRGLLLTALRGGMGEIGAWFWSSLLFGLLHGANIVLGQDVGPTFQQIVFAFVFGSVLYASRRSTGTLLVPIVLHALWDFTTFMGSEGDVSAAQGLQGFISYVAVILFVVAAAKRSIFTTSSTVPVDKAAQTST